MADLVLILISGEELTQNLARSLAEAESHPWAFADWKRQMQAIKVGTEVAFVELVDEQGRQVNRFTSNSATLATRRIVSGQVSRAIDERTDPHFAGYPFEFRFSGVRDRTPPTPFSLRETVAYLNEMVPGLRLEEVQFPELVKHAKANKIGVFIDGAPRKAEFFTDVGRTAISPVARATDVAAPGKGPMNEAGQSSVGGFATAVNAFARAVEKAGVLFLGANEDLPRAFLAALAAKRFAILSGTSGSGKTQLARSLGQWLGADELGPRYLVVPVRPDWTSPEPLLGYEDALLPPNGSRRAWTAPAALRFILRAARSPDQLYLLVLDEMNLAHVERYFADVLSGLESGERVIPAIIEEADGYWRMPSGGPDLLAFPENLIVVGTVNIDETTYQFSPKVLDRAFTFDFRVSSSELGRAARRPVGLPAASPEDLAELSSAIFDDDWHLLNPAPRLNEVVEQLVDLHERLSTIGFEFGHRTFFEATRMAATLASAGIAGEEAELDWILMTKILPRLHGSRRQLEPFLSDLLMTAAGTDQQDPPMPRTARKVARMLDLIRANQFVSFAE